MPRANRDDRAAYNHEYRAAHSEELREYERNRPNRVTRIDFTREWRKRNPDLTAGYRAQRKLDEEYVAQQRARQINNREHKREVINAIKVSRGCVDCGYNLSPVALDFDHRDHAAKDFNIGSSTGRSFKRIMDEIDKCDVRCANCHRIKSYIDRAWENRKPGMEGTGNGWRAH